MNVSNPNLNVSIIIPAHNAEETLKETVESLLAQTYSDWEAIIVDDGSLDKTAEIAESFIQRDYRIRLIQQVQKGEAGARNAGLALANFDWVLFLDSDDWIAPDYLERMTEALKQDPKLDAVHCRSARVAKDGTVVIEKYVPPSGDLFAVLARRAAFPVHACIVRKSIVEAVGKFDPSLEKSPDWDLWQRIARTGAQFGAVDEVLAFYRMQPNAASLDASAMLRDGLRVLKQGHAPDSRVPNPHPDHANGLAAELIPSQEFYLLCWCAGLMLGTGQDPTGLLDFVKTDSFPDLYPPSVAQCIYDAAPLPNCLAPIAWYELAPRIFSIAGSFLQALERQSQTPDLASRTDMELKKMILKQSEHWEPLIESFEKQLDKQKTELLSAYQALSRLEEEKLDALKRIDDAWSENANLQQIIRQKEAERAETDKRFLKQISDLESARAALQAEIESTKAEFQSTNAELESTKTKLESELQQQRDEYSALLEERNALAQLAAERKNAIAALRKTFWVRVGKKIKMVD